MAMTLGNLEARIEALVDAFEASSGKMVDRIDVQHDENNDHAALIVVRLYGIRSKS